MDGSDGVLRMVLPAYRFGCGTKHETINERGRLIDLFVHSPFDLVGMNQIIG